MEDTEGNWHLQFIEEIWTNNKSLPTSENQKKYQISYAPRHWEMGYRIVPAPDGKIYLVDINGIR